MGFHGPIWQTDWKLADWKVFNPENTQCLLFENKILQILSKLGKYYYDYYINIGAS